MLFRTIRDFDDFGEVGRIFNLDIRVCKKNQGELKINRESERLRINRVLNLQAIQLCLSKSTPNFRPFDFVGP
jgi:hypothetical protein